LSTLATLFSSKLTLFKAEIQSFKVLTSSKLKELIIRFKTPLGLEWKSFVIMGTIIILFVLYIGSLLFGSSSLRVLYDLKDKEQYLEKKVQSVKEENAQLHKQYLEYMDAQK